jgi:hypothetical protein
MVIERRAADNLEHVCGRSLLLQRLSKLAEQPRIFDGDDGLGGEILHQLDLFVGEGPNLLTVDDDGANQRILFEHWHDDARPCAAKPCHVTER